MFWVLCIYNVLYFLEFILHILYTFLYTYVKIYILKTLHCFAQWIFLKKKKVNIQNTQQKNTFCDPQVVVFCALQTCTFWGGVAKSRSRRSQTRPWIEQTHCNQAGRFNCPSILNQNEYAVLNGENILKTNWKKQQKNVFILRAVLHNWN